MGTNPFLFTFYMSPSCTPTISHNYSISTKPSLAAREGRGYGNLKILSIQQLISRHLNNKLVISTTKRYRGDKVITLTQKHHIPFGQYLHLLKCERVSVLFIACCRDRGRPS